MKEYSLVWIGGFKAGRSHYYEMLIDRQFTNWVRGDFARGQRTPRRLEHATIPLGSFGDVER